MNAQNLMSVRPAKALIFHTPRGHVVNKASVHKAAGPTIESTIEYFANVAMTKTDIDDTVKIAALVA